MSTLVAGHMLYDVMLPAMLHGRFSNFVVRGTIMKHRNLFYLICLFICLFGCMYALIYAIIDFRSKHHKSKFQEKLV